MNSARVWVILILISVLGVSNLSAQGGVQLPSAIARSAVPFASGQVLVQLDDSGRLDSVLAARGMDVLEVGDTFAKVQVPAGSEWQTVLELYESGFSWASPNFRATGHGGTSDLWGPPNDPLYDFQAHLQLIDVESAWKRGNGSSDVVVAVIDSGVAYEDRPIPDYELGGVVPGASNYFRAPDLAETSFVPGFDFVFGDAHANDDRFHGTAVAAVIAQSTNNGLQAAGIAPGVSIMPIKSNDVSGSGSLANIISAIEFATAAGVDVINMSLGFPAFASDPMFDPFFAGLDAALEAAHGAGIVLVASTGNEGVGVVSRPALHPDVIAVGASNFDGLTRAVYSQSSTLESFVFGTPIPPTPGLPGSVELVAPTGDGSDKDLNGIPDAVIQETMLTNNPESFAAFLLTGTSFSAPQVSAVAALMISNGARAGKDGLAVDILREVLRENAIDLGPPGPDLSFGAGQLNAGAAVTANKIWVCHASQNGQQQSLRVGIPASRAHVEHGDAIGTCLE